MATPGAPRRGGPGGGLPAGSAPADAAPRGGQGRVLRRLGRLSLRSRLLVGLVLVAVVGLGVASAAVYGQIRSYLVNQLQADVQQGALSAARGSGFSECAVRFTTLPVGSWIYVYDPTSLQQICTPTAVTRPGAALPPTSDEPPVSSSFLQQVVSSGNGGWMSASSPSGVGYEVYAQPPGFVSGSMVVAAEPLTGVDETMHRLLLIDLAVYAAVLALLVALGYAVVRVGLRPLEEIEVTAGKIAAGDLSRRVERDEPETEVGRLGASLNAMLARIEHAFAEQQSSERRLRQFIADASHELRTPLTSIRGYAELFRRGAAARPEDLERSMRRIEEEAARMGGLVEDLLLLARLDQGRPLEHAPVDLAALAADAAADAQAVQPDRPVAYDGSGAVLVDGDEARLRQVAANLVQNALVHTPPETPVWVSVRRDGPLAVLEVTDAGPGIPPEHAEHIFERFYRADSSRTRQSGGTGLGLSIVASLAAAHGGRAVVETAPGAGASFRVELPAIDRPPALPAARDAPASGWAAPALRPGPPSPSPDVPPPPNGAAPTGPASLPPAGTGKPAAPNGDAPASAPAVPAPSGTVEAGDPAGVGGSNNGFGGASGFAEDWDPADPQRVL